VVDCGVRMRVTDAGAVSGERLICGSRVRVG
jgi:hypothetical protein